MSIFERRFAPTQREAGGAPKLRRPAKQLPPITDTEFSRIARVTQERALELALSKTNDRGVAVFCGPADSIGASYRDRFDALGTNLIIAFDNQSPVNWICNCADELDYVVIDAEFYGDIEATIDIAVQIRNSAPSLPIILVSSEVAGDDLTAERMMACDATLKAPFSAERLENALLAAHANNTHYRRSRGFFTPEP